MDFRVRDYIANDIIHSLPRVQTNDHPLIHVVHSASTSSPQVEVIDHQKHEFYDPLRGPAVRNVEDSDADLQDAAGLSTNHGIVSGGKQLQLEEKEWASFKSSLTRRFPILKTVSVSSISDVIIKRAKAAVKSSVSLHADQLDDQQKKSEDLTVITREEYASRLRELKEEISGAWKDDRVTSLNLSIKVARLLMDTSVSLFYPTLFFLVTDIMDMLGEMVWNRILKKAEYSDDGNMICSLPDDFRASDICSDAKETCNNWFCKIGSIHELLPRIYLELAILRCWRFMNDRPWESLQRLVLMIRGLGDPLAFAYCHLYMVRCAQKLAPQDRGYLMSCINDVNIVLTSMTSGKELNALNSENKRSIISLMEPTIEWITRFIFKDKHLVQVEDILVDLKFGRHKSKTSSNFPCVSIILHHLIKELPAESACSNALDIVELIDCAKDFSYHQYMNYKLLGLKLCERRPQMSYVGAILSKVFLVVTEYISLDEYLEVMDAYLDIVLQYQMDNYLVLILDGIATRARNKEIGECELNILQSIFIKLLSHFNNLGDALALEHFIEILDVIHGSSRNAVNMYILHKATRNDYICDAIFIQFLFEICLALHNAIDFSNINDIDHHQSARLISCFVQKVDYGTAVDRQLAFLVECRGAFVKLNDLKEVLVHISNNIVIKEVKGAKNNVSFVKSCITFSEVTIPSISGCIEQMNLYLETAEVAQLGGLVSHADGLIDSAITCCIVDTTDGSQSPINENMILSLIEKLCGLLVIISGNPLQGATYFPRSILSVVDSQPWITPRVRLTTLCAIVSLSATLSQKMLPYHANNTEVLSNDLLFFGDSTYYQELASISQSVVDKMVDVIQQEKYRNARGSMALKACNCILLFYMESLEVSRICSELIEIAKSCLNVHDKYLQSTMNSLTKK